jgi:hypothetical protein
MTIASGTSTISTSSAYHTIFRDSIIVPDYAQMGPAHKAEASWYALDDSPFRYFPPLSGTYPQRFPFYPSGNRKKLNHLSGISPVAYGSASFCHTASLALMVSGVG